MWICKCPHGYWTYSAERALGRKVCSTFPCKFWNCSQAKPHDNKVLNAERKWWHTHVLAQGCKKNGKWSGSFSPWDFLPQLLSSETFSALVLAADFIPLLLLEQLFKQVSCSDRGWAVPAITLWMLVPIQMIWQLWWEALWARSGSGSLDPKEPHGLNLAHKEPCSLNPAYGVKMSLIPLY